MERENAQMCDGCVSGGCTSLLHTSELIIPPREKLYPLSNTLVYPEAPLGYFSIKQRWCLGTRLCHTLSLSSINTLPANNYHLLLLNQISNLSIGMREVDFCKLCNEYKLSLSVDGYIVAKRRRVVAFRLIQYHVVWMDS